MYKLLCSNLTKSQRSLTNFTGYYRKVAEKCNRSASSSKKFISDTDLHNKQTLEENTEPVECSEEILDTEPISEKESKSYTNFLSQKITRMPLGYTRINKEHQITATAPSSSKFFHSTFVNNKFNNPSLKKPFKSKEAEKYYKMAVQQCMQIKLKLSKFQHEPTWAPRPLKTFIPEKKELDYVDQKKSKNLKKVREEQSYMMPELDKIARIKTSRPNYQFKQSKIRITYPTHMLRYKVGTNDHKLQHKVKQQVVRENKVKTIYRDPIPESLHSIKVKHETSTEMEKAMLQKLKHKARQRILTQNKYDKNSEQAKHHSKLEQAVIKQHPTVRQANTTVKMAFKNRYNRLLKKSELVYQGPNKTRGEEENTVVKGIFNDEIEIMMCFFILQFCIF